MIITKLNNFKYYLKLFANNTNSRGVCAGPSKVKPSRIRMYYIAAKISARSNGDGFIVRLRLGNIPNPPCPA